MRIQINQWFSAIWDPQGWVGRRWEAWEAEIAGNHLFIGILNGFICFLWFSLVQFVFWRFFIIFGRKHWKTKGIITFYVFLSGEWIKLVFSLLSRGSQQMHRCMNRVQPFVSTIGAPPPSFSCGAAVWETTHLHGPTTHPNQTPCQALHNTSGSTQRHRGAIGNMGIVSMHSWVKCTFTIP